MQRGVEQVRAQGLGVAAISYDRKEILAGFSAQHEITYSLLSDEGSDTIKRFGLLNPVPQWALDPQMKDDPEVRSEVQKYVSVVRPAPFMVGVAFPGVLLVDATGKVTERFFEESYIERNTVSSLMLKLDGARNDAVPATKISTAHLDATIFASAAAVAPGQRVAVSVEVQPHGGIHVYALGSTGYRVIRLKIDSSPEFTVTGTTGYPKPEIYHFKPFNERVPVFQRPFRLTQDVILNGTLQAQAVLRGKETLALQGSLEYQACDDKQCFNPISVPISWTFKVESLVFQRPPSTPAGDAKRER